MVSKLPDETAPDA